MDIARLTKSLQKKGWIVESTNGVRFRCVNMGRQVTFVRDHVLPHYTQFVRLTPLHDQDDSRSDYHAGYFCRTIKEVVKYLGGE